MNYLNKIYRMGVMPEKVTMHYKSMFLCLVERLRGWNRLPVMVER
ncbi:MAG: hypothetical protein AB1546_15990 [bacterium]